MEKKNVYLIIIATFAFVVSFVVGFLLVNVYFGGIEYKKTVVKTKLAFSAGANIYRCPGLGDVVQFIQKAPEGAKILGFIKVDGKRTIIDGNLETGSEEYMKIRDDIDKEIDSKMKEKAMEFGGNAVVKNSFSMEIARTGYGIGIGAGASNVHISEDGNSISANASSIDHSGIIIGTLVVIIPTLSIFLIIFYRQRRGEETDEE